jgi:AAA+ ATPase superfamily predicted ATPase
MEPFITGVDITNIEYLYGRNREINTLISCAKRKGNAGIIGARRFGKTCLIKSLESYLLTNEQIPFIF